MKQRLTKLIAILGIAVTIIVIIVWVGTIRSVVITGNFTREPQLLSKLGTCLEKYKEQSLWLLNEQSVIKTLQDCDPIVITGKIAHKIPGKLSVEVTQLEPIIKVDVGEGQCQLVQDSAHIIEVTSERCLAHPAPVLSSAQHELSSFVFDFAVNLIEATQQENITVSKIEYKGEQVAPWYAITLDSGTVVYLPASAVIKQKVLTLSAALKGLNDAQERYSVIDLRFDRVVYK